MTAFPATLMSTLTLTLFCGSVLGHSSGNSSQPTLFAPIPGAPQPDSPTTKPNITMTTTTHTSEANDTDGGNNNNNNNPWLDPSNRTADITQSTIPASTSTPITSARTDRQPKRVTEAKASMARTVSMPAAPEGSSSAATTIVVCLVVLVILLILFLYVVSLLRNLRWARCVWGAVGGMVLRARALLSWLGVRLWPGKSGGHGGGDEEEEGGEREEDVELGNGMDAESKKEKKEEEEEEEEDSTDDYSSLEGFDLRERARQREAKEDAEEEKEGKRRSQSQGGDGEQEEGKSEQAMLLEKSKEGGMEECDLTVL